MKTNRQEQNNFQKRLQEMGDFIKGVLESQLAEDGYLSGCNIDFDVNDKSAKINSGSINMRLSIPDVLNDREQPARIDCSLFITEKIVSYQSKDVEKTFTWTSALFVNNKSHLVIWDKITKHSIDGAVPYLVGWIINSVAMARNQGRHENIKELSENIIHNYLGDAE